MNKFCKERTEIFGYDLIFMPNFNICEMTGIKIKKFVPLYKIKHFSLLVFKIVQTFVIDSLQRILTFELSEKITCFKKSSFIIKSLKIVVVKTIWSITINMSAQFIFYNIFC